LAATHEVGSIIEAVLGKAFLILVKGKNASSSVFEDVTMEMSIPRDLSIFIVI